jgi:hypothetical protein
MRHSRVAPQKVDVNRDRYRRKARQKPRGEEAHLISPLANREIFAQGVIEGPVGHEQVIIHPSAARFVPERFDVSVKFLAVFIAHVFRRDLDPIPRFEIDERCGFAEFGLDLMRVEDMKEYNLVSVETQRFDRTDDVLRRIVKVGDEDDDPTAAQELLKVVQRLGEVSSRLRLGILEAA